MEVNFDFDAKKLNRGFADINKATGIATRNTLDTMAFLTRRNAIKNIKDDFTVRNTFSTRQVQVEKVSTERVGSMQSSVGATEKASYMALQETGGTRKPSGSGKNLAIPTSYTRGGSNKSAVVKSRRLNKMRYARYGGKKKPKGRKAQIMMRAMIAFETGKELKLRSGIYKVTSVSENGFKTRMLYNTKPKTTKVKSTPWLEPATKKPIQDGQAIFNSQVNKLLRGKVI